MTSVELSGYMTYVHFGRNAESMMAPHKPRCFQLKSASTMEVSMATGLLSLKSPLNVNCDMAPMSWITSARAVTPEMSSRFLGFLPNRLLEMFNSVIPWLPLRPTARALPP